MKLLKNIFLIISYIVIFSTSILAQPAFISSLDKYPSRVYFNHKNNVFYYDPYRKGLLRKGDNLEQVLINAVNLAKKSIFIAVYDFDLPLLARTLAEAKKDGKDVRVIIDNDTTEIHEFAISGTPPRILSKNGEESELSKKINNLRLSIDINKDGKISLDERKERDALYILKTAKIPVIDDTHDGSAGSGLMHHKFTLIDDDQVVVSSSNYTWSCTHGDVNDPRSIGNANSMIHFRSVGLNKFFKEEFMIMWGTGTSHTSKFGINKPHRPNRIVKFGGSNIEMSFSPHKKEVPYEQRPLGMIASLVEKSQRSTEMALFVYSEQNISNLLEKKSSEIKGYTVKGVGDRRFFMRHYSDFLDALGVEIKNSANCKGQEGNKPWTKQTKNMGVTNLGESDKFHHKFALIDNKVLAYGSLNWSQSSDTSNDEFLLIIRDPYIVNAYRQGLGQIYQTTFWGLSPAQKEHIRSINSSCNGAIRDSIRR